MDEPMAVTGTVGVANVGDYKPDEWPVYYKQVPTRAIRVAGPFTVLIHNSDGADGGEINCPDGYLALDARGYPYPIATDEFEQIYGPDRPAPAFPPTSLHELAVAHSYGIIEKDVARTAASKLLKQYGLIDDAGMIV